MSFTLLSRWKQGCKAVRETNLMQRVCIAVIAALTISLGWLALSILTETQSGAAIVTAPWSPYVVQVDATPSQVTVTWFQPKVPGWFLASMEGVLASGKSPSDYDTCTLVGEDVESNGRSLSCRLTGLIPGHRYKLIPSVANDFGDIVAGYVSRFTFDFVPSSPRNITGMTITQGGLQVSWDPADDAGSPIGYYTATIAGSGKSCSVAGFSCVIPGRFAFPATITVSVAAFNAKGPGPATSLTRTFFRSGCAAGGCRRLVLFDGADLSSRDLRNIDLAGVAVHDVNFSRSRLDGANLSNFVCRHCSFDNASITRANLSSSTFDGSSIQNANLSKTQMSSSSLRQVDLTGARLWRAHWFGLQTQGVTLPPGGWQITSGILIGPGADLRSLNLRRAVLSGGSVSHVLLSGAKLDHIHACELTGFPDGVLPESWSFQAGALLGPTADLSGCHLAEGNLTGVDLSNAVLNRVSSGDLSGTSSSVILPSAWHLISGHLVGPSADLGGVDLANASLAGTDLSGVRLTGANLTGVSSGGISGVPDSLPLRWSLIGGYLIGPEANLMSADLRGLDLNGINVSGCDLTSASLGGVSSGGISGLPTGLPIGWKLTRGFLVGPDAVLAGADLRGGDISGASLQGADLSGAYLSGVRSGSTTGTPLGLPSSWFLTSGFLVGPGADLSNADLRNASLAGADLSNAILTGVQLATNLTGATLTGVSSGGVTGNPTLPSGWTLTVGYVVGPGANLLNAKLSNANLAYVDLSTTVLTGVSSGGVTGSPSLPSGWRVVNGYLTGAGANLDHANLSFSDLSGLDLTGSNLHGASVVHSNLQGANFLNALVSGLQAGDSYGYPIGLPQSCSYSFGHLDSCP